MAHQMLGNGIELSRGKAVKKENNTEQYGRMRSQFFIMPARKPHTRNAGDGTVPSTVF